MTDDIDNVLTLLAANDERQTKLHELLETIREQIRLDVAPEHRPKELFKNIQDAVYAMRGRMPLMNDAAITEPLTRLREQAGRAVEVKALEWAEPDACGVRTAMTAIGPASVWTRAINEWRWALGSVASGWERTCEDAIKMLTATHDNRIRSALVDAPAAAAAGNEDTLHSVILRYLSGEVFKRRAADHDEIARDIALALYPLIYLAAAPSPPSVEAVAWRQRFKSDPWTYHHGDWPYAESERAAGAIVEPLYASPAVEKDEVAVAVAAERVACAKAAYAYAATKKTKVWRYAAQDIAAAIRSRGEAG